MTIRRRPTLALLTTFATLLLAGAVVVAQVTAPATCPDLVLRALQTVNDLCQGQGRNSACYGNYLVEAQLAADQPQDVFDAPADVAALTSLTALSTAPLNEDLSQWGVSILSVQANIPTSLPGQNSLFMLIGGAQIESAVSDGGYFTAADPATTIQAIADAPLYERPSENEAVSLTVAPGDALFADARSGDFLRVVVGDQFGWIRADQTSADANVVGALPVFAQGESFTPMQAFYLRTGIGQPLCSQAPSALVVQGPQGLHVNIEANGADITLGSTILLRSYSVEEAQQAGLPIGDLDSTGGVLELTVIDGRAIVRQEDGTLLYIDEGYQSFICLNRPANLGADGATNDQTITYGCGGWTVPDPIPQALRDSFALVDDYPLIYPVDIMTPTPTAVPTQTREGATPAAPTATQTAPATTATGSSLSIRALLSLSPMSSVGLPSVASIAAQTSFQFEASVTIVNRGSSTLNNVVVTGILPQAGAVNAQVSQGSFDSDPSTWRVGTLPPAAEATLHLTGVIAAGCGDIVSGAINVSAPDDPGSSLSYAMSADCDEPSATVTPSVTPSNTQSPTPSLTPSATASNTPTLTPTLTPSNTQSLTPSATPTHTPTNTPVPPTATPTQTPTLTPSNTPTNTPVPPTATHTPTNTPVPRVSPVLECVRDNGSGSYTAFFGYNNTSVTTQTIAVGGSNRFNPAPDDRGQPTSFQPGRQSNVFSVTWDGSNLVWVLNLNGQGGTSTANSGSSRCAGQQPTATPTPSNTPVPPTATATATNTPVPPTATATNTSTPVPPTVTATPTDDDEDDEDDRKVTICHNGDVTLEIPRRTAYEVHLNPDGSGRGGHEGDYLGPCLP